MLEWFKRRYLDLVGRSTFTTSIAAIPRSTGCSRRCGSDGPDDQALIAQIESHRRRAQALLDVPPLFEKRGVMPFAVDGPSGT